MDGMSEHNEEELEGEAVKEPEHEPEVLAALVDSQRKDLVERKDRLEAWLGGRQSVMDSNLSAIDSEIGKMDCAKEWSRSINPYDHEAIRGLEKLIMENELRKGLERSGAWKDMWLVQKELLEITKELQRLKRMEEMVR